MPDHRIAKDKFYVALPEDTILSKAWHALTPSTRCLYLAMLTRYMRVGPKANGRVKWKQPELVEKTGLSLRTVITCLQELKDEDWISVWEPGGRWLDGTIYTVNPKYADGEAPDTT